MTLAIQQNPKLQAEQSSAGSSEIAISLGLKPKERFWEIDFIRGVALIMMLILHFIVDLQYFANYTQFSELWWKLGRMTAFMFVFLVGISLNINYSRARQEGKANFIKYLKRGLFIFGAGLAITVITYFTIPQYYIRFGILHLIGISIILTYPFLKWKKGVSLWLGLVFIALGFVLSTITLNTDVLLWLGLTSANFASADYFPLLPWFGVVLLGSYFGKILYKDGKRAFKLKFNLKNSNPLCFLGRNTLWIYFIHQPIYIAVLHFLLGVKIF